MTTTCTWTIESLECYPTLDGQELVVCAINWKAEATDGTVTASEVGSVALAFENGPHFTSYNDLTEQQVMGWLVNAKGTLAMQTINNGLISEVTNNSKPITPPLPWSA